MEFIIWGAGARGRRLRRYLREEKVIAYIDARKDLHGTIYDGIPVIKFSDYLKNINQYQDAWIIVTPLFFMNDIVDELKRNNIRNFFSLGDCPDGFYDYSIDELEKIKIHNIKGRKILNGFNLCNYLIAVRKQTCGEDIAIAVSDNDYDYLTNYFNDSIKFIKGICSLYTDRYIIEEQLNRRKLIKTDERLKKLKDKYKERRCFIVATGPSLKMEDLDMLYKHKELCISMNNIFKSESITKWRPDLYVYTDQMVVDVEDEIEAYNVEYKLISDTNMDYWDGKKHADNIYCVHMNYNEREICFSDDITKGVFCSCNVTYVCLQVAVYLGCKEIFLLGVDFYNLLNKANRKSHFIDGYNDDDKKIDSQLVLENIYTDEIVEKNQIRGYKKTKEFCDSKGIKVYNATRGGRLEVFPRVDFDSLF